MTLDDNSPGAALDAIRQSQSATADRISKGGWLYDITYSALVAGMIAGAAVPMPNGLIVVGACVGLLLLLAFTWARHHGLWLSGVTPPRARWVAIGLSGGIAGLYALNMLGTPFQWPHAVAAALTGVAFVAALIASRLWRRVYRREMGLKA